MTHSRRAEKRQTLAKSAASAIAVASVLATAPPLWAQDLDVTGLTIKEIQAGLEGGAFTSEELTRAYLDRIERYEPFYNAFVHMNLDALAEARAVDERRATGETLGPLAGVPTVIKEAMDVAGLPSTAGWAPLSSEAGGIDLIPESDAPVVARLRAAGAVVLGKTNIPAFSDDGTRANSSWAGPTFNAVDRSIVPGASSSGTATAVAGSFAPFGLAEETGGSIQNPAAAQSLVGIKPTFGLVPNTGVAPLAGSTRDVVGPIAATVEDAALVLDALAGYTAEDPKTVASIGMLPEGGYTSLLDEGALEGARVGLYGPGWREEPLSDEAQALYEEAIAGLEEAGAVVVEDPFAGSGFHDLREPKDSYDPRGTESLAYDFNSYLTRLGSSAAASSVEELQAILDVDPLSDEGPLGWYANALPVLAESRENPTAVPDLSGFHALREEYLQSFNGVMAEHDLDLLVFPQMSSALPGIFEEDKDYPATTVSEINILGVPAVTMPAGSFGNGSPFSLIFIGELWDEAQLLGFAHAYERAAGNRIKAELVETPYEEAQAAE
ncbi:MAG: amidase [Alphaproteobacteria bacterium]|nr:amidase [Alphaproteobacteria bacterium]